MIPTRDEAVVFGFVPSGLISFTVTAIAAFLKLGPAAGYFASRLLQAWPVS